MSRTMMDMIFLYKKDILFDVSTSCHYQSCNFPPPRNKLFVCRLCFVVKAGGRQPPCTLPFPKTEVKLQPDLQVHFPRTVHQAQVGFPVFSPERILDNIFIGSLCYAM